MENVKKLGFGMMRLPIGADKKIDIEQTKEMVDLFMDAGFNYFDTAWQYPGSEQATRQALVERYPRESFYLATKNSAWAGLKSRQEAVDLFDISLRQTGAGYFDFYLLHNLGNERSKCFDDWGLWDWIQEKKAKGEIKYWGFSIHDTADELKKILDAHDKPDFVQLQINYADWDNAEIQSGECYRICKERGIPVIVMEPVKGGMLANTPEAVTKILKDAEPHMSTASWALRFAADLDGVLTVLSGMSNVEQVKDNISIFKDFKGLTDKEREVIKEAQKELAMIPLVPCTACKYCVKECPMNVAIPASFRLLNEGILYGKEFAKHGVDWFIKAQGTAFPSECIECGACESVCPQHIQIREKLKEASEMFE